MNEAKDEAKAAAAKAVSEYQSSTKMAVLRQTIWDKAFEEVAESFAYTTTIQYLDWDLAYWVNTWLLRLRSGVLSSRLISHMPNSVL